MKFQKYDHKIVMKTAQEKKEILYKNQCIRFYNDLACDVHKQ